ncbi:hypothetical protein CEXT_181671 [Caerostris extrusa]|uniref:Uncharacterized protein n=1 Tax=Caerostris extrusa TaxID=172846 RepID=A0AAV4MM66_CAEEX|nr:hypothetical protein CEXT_181671 [Caerostris extrusa]
MPVTLFIGFLNCDDFHGMECPAPRPTPNLEDQSPDIIPRDRVPRLSLKDPHNAWLLPIVAQLLLNLLVQDHSINVITNPYSSVSLCEFHCLVSRR